MRHIPPRDSPYFNPDIFDELQYDIAKPTAQTALLCWQVTLMPEQDAH